MGRLRRRFLADPVLSLVSSNGGVRHPLTPAGDAFRSREVQLDPNFAPRRNRHMKRKSLPLWLALAAGLVLGLAGCGQKESKVGDSKGVPMPPPDKKTKPASTAE